MKKWRVETEEKTVGSKHYKTSSYKEALRLYVEYIAKCGYDVSKLGFIVREVR